MTFASESVLQALNIITILNILGRTQGGGGGNWPIPVNFISPDWLFFIFFASNPLLRKNGG
jgi:hypothetical protein